MKYKKTTKFALLFSFLLCFVNASYTSEEAPTSMFEGFRLSNISSGCKEVAKTLRYGAAIIRYSSIFIGAVYGIRAASKGAQAIGTLAPSKCLEFGKYSLMSGLFLGVARVMRGLGAYI